MATRKRPAGTIRIDFTQEESGGGGRVRVPEGDYKARVFAVKPDTSKEGNPMLVWTFEGVSGKLKGKKLTDYTSLTPKALWKVRSILEALGVEAPSKSVFELPTKKVLNKELGITLEDDEYNGKISSKIQDYIDIDTLENNDSDDDDDDEEDLEDEETEDDEDEDDDEEKENDDDGLNELDRAGLKKHIKENDLDVTVKKSMDDTAIRTAIREAEDDDDDDEIGSLDLEDDEL
jgi:hypothetical protein